MTEHSFVRLVPAILPIPEILVRLEKWLSEDSGGWLDDSNIIGLGIGEKRVADSGIGALALVVFVRTKMVRPGKRSRMVPSMIELDEVSIPTDVVECDFAASVLPQDLVPPAVRSARHETVRPGMACSSQQGLGTIACLVRRTDIAAVLALSNQHVLRSLGEAVFQPTGIQGAPMGDKVGDVVANLGFQGVDAAIATITRRRSDPRIIGLDKAVMTVKRAAPGDLLVKSGVTTGITYGRVVNHAVRLKLNYPFGSRLIEGFLIAPDPAFPALGNVIASEGDSGAAWMLADAMGRPTEIMVGLQVAVDQQAGAGSAMRQVALACHSDDTFSRLKLAPLMSAPTHPGMTTPGSVSGEMALRTASPAAFAMRRPMVAVARSNLRLRALPSEDAEITGRLPPGALVDVLSEDASWALVDLKGDGNADGYVWGGFLRPPAEQAIQGEI